TNQRFPSVPVVMSIGNALGVGTSNLSNTPELRSKRQIWLPSTSVNQMFPSGPTVIPEETPKNENMNSVITPSVVILPILPVEPSVNQRLPSGPATMSLGVLNSGVLNVVESPPGVIRPMRLEFWIVYHRLPSGPSVISMGWLPLGTGNDTPCEGVDPAMAEPGAASDKARASGPSVA